MPVGGIRCKFARGEEEWDRKERKRRGKRKGVEERGGKGKGEKRRREGERANAMEGIEG